MLQSWNKKLLRYSVEGEPSALVRQPRNESIPLRTFWSNPPQSFWIRLVILSKWTDSFLLLRLTTYMDMVAVFLWGVPTCWVLGREEK